MVAASKVGRMARAEKEPDQSTYSGRIAARVRSLRKRQKMSREELWVKLDAAGCRISVASLYAIENGNVRLNPDFYPAFSKALGCKTVREFLPTN